LGGRRFTKFQTLAFAISAFAFTVSSTLAFAKIESRSCSRPGVTVLGSGSDLSILVADGPARLLLATGDNAAGIGNALEQSRGLIGCDRIDVLLLAGSTNDITFLSRARRASKARHVEAIGSPDLLGALGLPPESLLPSPRRFRLSTDTSVTVETAERLDADEGPHFGWRATIEHGATRVLVLSDGRFAGVFQDLGPVSALVVGGSNATEALDEVETRVFVTAASDNPGKDVRAAVAASGSDDRWVVRVFPGEAKRLAFADRGLMLPSEAVAVGTPEVPQTVR
jgi:hypothetical protein